MDIMPSEVHGLHCLLAFIRVVAVLIVIWADGSAVA